MEIKRFKKIKSNIYEIELDDGLVIKLYDDVIVKYNLLVNKVLDNKLIKEITNYNDSLDAYYVSIKYISKKLKCEKEIRDYLEKKKYDKDIIDDTIKRLSDNKFLDHKIYLTSYINDSFNFTNDGPYKVKNNLIKLGFLEDEIDLYLTKDYSDKVINIINKKLKANHKQSLNVFKMSMSNYLYNLGYSKEMFETPLNEIKIDNSELIKKEFDLLYKKYSKKYENDELKYIIKDKLYKKGYNIDEISEVLNELF